MIRPDLHDRYRDELGPEALERQRVLAKERHKCCGEEKSGPHHEGCHLYDPDPLPALIDGQESLL